jgi:hypothetical protein
MEKRQKATGRKQLDVGSRKTAIRTLSVFPLSAFRLLLSAFCLLLLSHNFTPRKVYIPQGLFQVDYLK